MAVLGVDHAVLGEDPARGVLSRWRDSGMAGTPWPEGGGGVDITSPSKVQGTDPKAMIKPLKADPVAGDIAYSQSNNQHYCIVLRVQGDTVYTIDGNTSGGGSTTGGKIMSNSRSKSWYSRPAPPPQAGGSHRRAASPRATQRPPSASRRRSSERPRWLRSVFTITGPS